MIMVAGYAKPPSAAAGQGGIPDIAHAPYRDAVVALVAATVGPSTWDPAVRVWGGITAGLKSALQELKYQGENARLREKAVGPRRPCG